MSNLYDKCRITSLIEHLAVDKPSCAFDGHFDPFTLVICCDKLFALGEPYDLDVHRRILFSGNEIQLRNFDMDAGETIGAVHRLCDMVISLFMSSETIPQSGQRTLNFLLKGRVILAPSMTG